MEHIGLIGYGLLGQVITEHLKNKGYQVVVFDIIPTTEHTFFKMDITDEASVAQTISLLTQSGIKLGAIINCSYPRGKDYGHKLEEVSLSSFNENVSLHLGGYFNIMKQFGFYLKSLGGGAIISFSSIYGLSAPRFEIYDGLPFTMPVEYAAIKAAILHLNKYMAKYFAGTNVRFNSLSPGGIFSNHDEKFVSAYGQFSLHSKKGMLMPADLAGPVEFLISSAANHLNGQNLVIDDGWTL